MNEGGDCFQANAEFLLENYVLKSHFPKDIFLCHGDVIGSPTSKIAGKVFKHAWIEFEGRLMVDFSNGNKIAVPLQQLYNSGRVFVSTVKKYSLKEMSKMILKTGHYGYWEKGEGGW